MILKYHTHEDDGTGVWVIHDRVDWATATDSKGMPGKDIRFWKGNGYTGGPHCGVDEAYLMNDRGQTIERLA